MTSDDASEREKPVEGNSGPPQPNIPRGLFYFGIFNVIAFAMVAGIYQLIYHGDFMSPAFEVVYEYFRVHEVQAVLAASLPFFASCLVGYGYARRAAKRKAAQAQQPTDERRFS